MTDCFIDPRHYDEKGLYKESIVERDGCTIVYGDIPIQTLATIAASQSSGSVLDLHVARLLGASLAAGPKRALDALARDETVRAGAMDAVSRLPGAEGLSRPALEWLAWGRRGLSSNAIFERLTGVACADMSSRSRTTDHPRDLDDFLRCQRLLEEVPELAGRLGEMAGLTPAWSALAASWDEITDCLNAECPQWRIMPEPAPATSKLIRDILATAEDRHA